MARKTARQIAASRRNIRKAQLVSARKRRLAANKKTTKAKSARRKQIAKRAAIGVVATGAVVGAGLYANDRRKNVYLYHNTDKKYKESIKKNGLRGVVPGSYSHRVFREEPGMVFLSKEVNISKAFGNTVVRIKVPRKQFNKIAHTDYNMGQLARHAVKIHETDLKNHGHSMRMRPGGPMQRLAYKQMFPDGTKESYGQRKRKKKKR